MRERDPKSENRKPDKDNADWNKSEHDSATGSGVSRRDFLRISGISAALPLVVGPNVVLAARQEVTVYGPGKVAMDFTINGQQYKASLEPRVTLLDVLRDRFDLTGAKRVCDRGECGACTVLLDNKPIYACSILAIEAQHTAITTVESLMQQGNLHPIQQAFVDNDASQCGFCTPGFVVACKALLDQHPHPTAEDIRHGLSGNLCRCGTYDGIRKAVAQVSQKGQMAGD
jgi:xanthine dehydrogenase YagT iron-sulfur-binding subunit